MTHTFSSNAGLCYFNAASVADNTFIADFLVFTTVAFPVFTRSENLFAEQTVAFRLKSSVVNCLRLKHLTVRPFKNFLRGCKPNLY